MLDVASLPVLVPALLLAVAVLVLLARRVSRGSQRSMDEFRDALGAIAPDEAPTDDADQVAVGADRPGDAQD